MKDCTLIDSLRANGQEEVYSSVSYVGSHFLQTVFVYITLSFWLNIVKIYVRYDVRIHVRLLRTFTADGRRVRPSGHRVRCVRGVSTRRTLHHLARLSEGVAIYSQCDPALFDCIYI